MHKRPRTWWKCAELSIWSSRSLHLKEHTSKTHWNQTIFYSFSLFIVACSYQSENLWGRRCEGETINWVMCSFSYCCSKLWGGWEGGVIWVGFNWFLIAFFTIAYPGSRGGHCSLWFPIYIKTFLSVNISQGIRSLLPWTKKRHPSFSVGFYLYVNQAKSNRKVFFKLSLGSYADVTTTY